MLCNSLKKTKQKKTTKNTTTATKKNKKQKRTRLPVANSHQSYPAGVLWLIQTLFFPSNIYQSLLEETKAFHSQMDYNALQALTAGCVQKTSKGRQPTLIRNLHYFSCTPFLFQMYKLRPSHYHQYAIYTVLLKKIKKIKTSSNVKLIPRLL